MNASISVSRICLLAAVILFILAAIGIGVAWLLPAGLAAFALAFLVP